MGDLSCLSWTRTELLTYIEASLPPQHTACRFTNQPTSGLLDLPSRKVTLLTRA